MIPLWIWYGLAAQVLWVIGSIVDKVLLEKYFRNSKEIDAPGTLLVISGAYAFILSLVIGILFNDQIEFSLASLYGVIAGVLNAIWVLLFLHAINNAEVSRTVPIFQTIPIFGMLLAYFLLGEVLSSAQIIGILVVISGAFVLSFDFSKRALAIKPLLLMLAASAIIALQETVFKIGALDANFWNTAFWLGIGLVLFAFVQLDTNADTRREFLLTFKKKYRPIWYASAYNEFADNAANLTFAFAITLGPVALVQSVNAFQPALLFITTLALGLFFPTLLKEDNTRGKLWQKMTGIAVITVGSFLLYQTIT